MITIRMARCRLGYTSPWIDLWTRAAAALSLFKREGLPVEVLDELHWRIMPAIALIQPFVPDRGYIGDGPTAAMEKSCEAD